jgi:hypothetical protein
MRMRSTGRSLAYFSTYGLRASTLGDPQFGCMPAGYHVRFGHMANIVALQTALNRYPLDFKLNITGTVDSTTQRAVQFVLQWIAQNVATESDNANALQNQFTSISSISSSADGLTTYLNQIADTVAPGVEMDTSVPSGLPGQVAASITDAFKNVPTWALVGGGIVLAGLITWGVVSHKHKKKSQMRGFDHGFYDEY